MQDITQQRAALARKNLTTQMQSSGNAVRKGTFKDLLFEEEKEGGK